MIFKDLQSGLSLYVIDRNSMQIAEAKVLGIGALHVDTKLGNEYGVDVTFDLNGQRQCYTFKANASVGYVQNFAITPNRENVKREIELVAQESDNAIRLVDFHKQRLTTCQQMLQQWDPAYKERIDYENRFKEVQQHMTNMDEKMEKVLKQVGSLLDGLK